MTYETTILPHRDALYRFACQLTRDTDGAHDLVQETLARAFTRFHLLRVEGAALCWLRRMLRNLFLNQRQRAQRGGVPTLSLESLEEMGAVPACQVTPERALLTRHEATAIRRAVASLPDTYRECVILGHLNGLSYNEIADRMELPLSTVRTRLHRGRKHVLQTLRAQGFDC